MPPESAWPTWIELKRVPHPRCRVRRLRTSSVFLCEKKKGRLRFPRYGAPYSAPMCSSKRFPVNFRFGLLFRVVMSQCCFKMSVTFEFCSHRFYPWRIAQGRKPQTLRKVGIENVAYPGLFCFFPFGEDRLHRRETQLRRCCRVFYYWPVHCGLFHAGKAQHFFLPYQRIGPQ